MIIRILNEGQYQLDGNSLSNLGNLDHQLTEAIARNNDSEFRQTFGQMLDTVRTGGQRLPDYTLAESDLILPAPDTTLQEAQRLFSSHTGEA
ncbi:MAG: hypothetical protein AB1815_10385 [Bacillota bacterium]